MTEALTVEGLTAGYGAVVAVRDVSFTVNRGEIVALLGRNGAGKTSTLLAISGLLRARAGQVKVKGQPLALGRPHRATKAGVIQVPEDRAIFTGLTVRENLAVAGARKRSELAEVYELFPELEPLTDRRAGLLSGGEQQMLALARALRLRPDVLMIDEMSLGLAPVICNRLAQVVRRLADESGIAVLLVEQHLALALQIADRGYVLAKGSITMAGDRAELTARRDDLESSYIGGSST